MARYEPFGLAVLEAAQAGCPLVLADIPTFVELWGGAAEFVPPGDDGTLADVLARLAEDDAWRARLSEAARERARQYTPDAMAESALRVYRTLLAGERARPSRRLEAHA
jgi:glycosyltransferase involved in cell wall biosynthesis